MLSSEQLDAALKAELQRHTANNIGVEHFDASDECVTCHEFWPCTFLIQASISLKLSAIATILSGDFSALQLMQQGGIVRGAQRNRDGFKGPKV